MKTYDDGGPAFPQDLLSRLDEIRAHDKGLNLSHSDLYNAYYQARKDRAYLLALLDRIAAWIEATRHVESLAKHGRQKAEHYKDAANELTAILNTSRGES